MLVCLQMLVNTEGGMAWGAWQMLVNTEGVMAVQMPQWRKNALECAMAQESAALLRSQTDKAREILVSSRGPGSLRIRSPAAAPAEMGAIHRGELIDKGTHFSVLHPLHPVIQEEDDTVAVTQHPTRGSSEPSLHTSQVEDQPNDREEHVVEDKSPQKMLQKIASDPMARSRNEQMQQEKMREEAVGNLAKQLDNLELGGKLAKAMEDPGKILDKAEKLTKVWDHNNVKDDTIETKENVLEAQASDSALWREKFRARMRCLAGGEGREANLVAPQPNPVAPNHAPPAASTPASVCGGIKDDELGEGRVKTSIDVSSDARAAFVAALQGCVHVVVSSVSSPSASCVPERACMPQL
jgi:hypothetical protein